MFYRGGVEDTRLGAKAKAKDTKKKKKTEAKAKAKDSLSEDRTSRGQGQQCSRPRTKDTGASVLQKKKNVFKIFFQAISNSLAYPEFLIGGGLNHKSHEMKSSKFFPNSNVSKTGGLGAGLPAAVGFEGLGAKPPAVRRSFVIF